MAKRFAVAVVGIPVAMAVIYAGGWVLGIVLALVASGAAIELYRLSRLCGVHAFRIPGAIAAAVFVMVAAGSPSVEWAAPVLVGAMAAVVLLMAGAAVWARGVEGQPLLAASVTVFGAVLPGWTLAHVLFLRHGLVVAHARALAAAPSPFASDAWLGTALVVFVVGLTWLNDTSAYFAGRLWGRRKLIPRVSPGKTVVGAVAGVIAAVVVGGTYAWVVLDGWYGLGVGPVAGALGGLLIAVVAQVGDLAESVLKREAGVKDSGNLLPGHGGVLDRFDALFFSVPVAYWYLVAVLASGSGVR